MMLNELFSEIDRNRKIWILNILSVGALAALIVFGKTPVTPDSSSRVAEWQPIENGSLAPAPVLPYPEWESGMSVSTGQPGPKPSRMVANPFAPRKGEKQTWRLRATYEKPIDTVTLTFRFDNGAYPLELKLAEGTATDGWWEGSWTMPDTISDHYAIMVVLKSGDMVTKFNPVFR